MSNHEIDEIEPLVNNENISISNLEANVNERSNNITHRPYQNRYFNFLNIVYIICFGVIITALVYMKLNYDDQITQLKVQLENLNKDLIGIKLEMIKQDESIINKIDTIRSIEDNYQSITYMKIDALYSNITSIDKMVFNHEGELIRLLNHTNNADVLDQLQLTKHQVQSMLENEHNQIVSHIEASTKDVSDKLKQSNLELQATQRKIDEHLDQSVLNMKHVVDIATLQIQMVQEQVTDQMENITQHVDIIVHELTNAVDLAQDVIHNEVKSVEDTIEQYVIVTNDKFAAENDFVKYQLAGTFTLLGCLLSLWHVNLHLRNYNKPEVQRRIMAVLWMVPIYGVTSWVSLVCPRAEVFLSAFRDVYEAYAVYTFIALLIAILLDGKRLQDLINRLAERVVKESYAVKEYERIRLEQLKDTVGWFGYKTNNNHMNNSMNNNKTTKNILQKRPIEHIKPPCPCCYRRSRPVSIAAAWLYQCQLMAFQFVMIKPIVTLVPLILKYSKIYDVNKIPLFDKGSLNWLAPTLYIAAVQNISVFIAFYGLLSFYHGTEKELEWCNPWPKFLCIKGVVFATFWQNITIQLFSIMGWIDMKAAAQIQNLLICIEMLLASVAHFYIFPYEEWVDGYKKEKEKGIMLKDTLALVDFVNDIHLMVSKWDTGDEAHDFATPHHSREQLSDNVYNIHQKHSNSSGRSSRASSIHSPGQFIAYRDGDTALMNEHDIGKIPSNSNSYSNMQLHYTAALEVKEENPLLNSSPTAVYINEMKPTHSLNYGSFPTSNIPITMTQLNNNNSTTNDYQFHKPPSLDHVTEQFSSSYQSTSSYLSQKQHFSELAIQAKLSVLHSLKQITMDESIYDDIKQQSRITSLNSIANEKEDSFNTRGKFISPDDSLTFSPIRQQQQQQENYTISSATNHQDHQNIQITKNNNPLPLHLDIISANDMNTSHNDYKVNNILDILHSNDRFTSSGSNDHYNQDCDITHPNRTTNNNEIDLIEDSTLIIDLCDLSSIASVISIASDTQDHIVGQGNEDNLLSNFFIPIFNNHTGTAITDQGERGVNHIELGSTSLLLHQQQQNLISRPPTRGSDDGTESSDRSEYAI